MNQIIFALSARKTQFTFAKTLMIFFRMRTKDQGSAIDSLLILLPYDLTINSSMWQKNHLNPKIGSYILLDTFSNLKRKK